MAAEGLGNWHLSFLVKSKSLRMRQVDTKMSPTEDSTARAGQNAAEKTKCARVEVAGWNHPDSSLLVSSHGLATSPPLAWDIHSTWALRDACSCCLPSEVFTLILLVQV